MERGLQILEDKWETLDSYESMHYWFIDSKFNEFYKSHERIGITATVFSTIAIIIAALGLFSIAPFNIRTRRKEVGIRKVLGASMTSVTILLSAKFCYLILVAFMLSFPAIYYTSEEYLSNFANRINFDFSILITSGLCAFIVALLSVGIESVKTANANPVDSLRDE